MLVCTIAFSAIIRQIESHSTATRVRPFRVRTKLFTVVQVITFIDICKLKVHVLSYDHYTMGHKLKYTFTLIGSFNQLVPTVATTGVTTIRVYTPLMAEVSSGCCTFIDI